MPAVSDKLPEDFDIVVLGTGLSECIIAAACTRSGHKVLQLDRNNYYGDLWASFNLRAIHEWTTRDNRNGSGTEISPESLLRDDEEFVPIICRSFVENIHQQSHNRHFDDGSQESGTVADSYLQSIDPDWRKFSLDLLPKVLLSRSNMVQLLCDSGISRYCEFKCVDRLLSYVPDNDSDPIQVAPCSRGEIFQSDDISVREKRRVMRFLQKCIEWQRDPDETNDWKEYAEKPFATYVESFGITGHMKSILTDTLAILHPMANTEEGLEAVCQFMESVGRYGDSPFLWPLYGSGELPQCFARLCALYGGIYCLDRPIDGYIVTDNRIVAVVTQGQRINCNHVIANRAYVPQKNLGMTSQKRLNRAILITDRSILPDREQGHISLLNLVSLENDAHPYLLEVGHEACTAPRTKYVVHITAQSENDAHTILNPIVERFFTTVESEERKPRILWALYFDIVLPSIIPDNMPTNLRIVPTIDECLNYSRIIPGTRKIFNELCPDYDLLPSAMTDDEDEDEDEEEEEGGREENMGNSEREQQVVEEGEGISEQVA